MQIAVEKFSEATIGYRKDKEVANRWAKLFTTPYFLVSVVSFQNYILMTSAFWSSQYRVAWENEVTILVNSEFLL